MPTSTVLSSSAVTKAPGLRQRKLTTDAPSLLDVLSLGSANGSTHPDAARVVLIDTKATGKTDKRRIENGYS